LGHAVAQFVQSEVAGLIPNVVTEYFISLNLILLATKLP